MLSKKEIKLIKFIKYTPIFIVGSICLIITILLYDEIAKPLTNKVLLVIPVLTF